MVCVQTNMGPKRSVTDLAKAREKTQRSSDPVNGEMPATGCSSAESRVRLLPYVFIVAALLSAIEPYIS